MTSPVSVDRTPTEATSLTGSCVSPQEDYKSRSAVGSEGEPHFSPSRPHYLLFSEAREASEGEFAVADQGGAWHFILESVDGGSRFEATDQEEPMDRGRMELLAVVRGLEALDQPSRVTLVTSSRYVSRGLRFGLEQWRENDWHWERFGEMTPIRNGDLWQRIDRALQYHEVECRLWRFDLAERPLRGPHRRIRPPHLRAYRPPLQRENKQPDSQAEPVCQLEQELATDVADVGEVAAWHGLEEDGSGPSGRIAETWRPTVGGMKHRG